MNYWYKIVESDAKGNIKTLFHGLQGSRVLNAGKWLVAEMKPVTDSGSTTYISGWHIIPTKEECEEYLTFFKHVENKLIVKCRAKNIRPKSHSRSNVFLAERIFIEN